MPLSVKKQLIAFIFALIGFPYPVFSQNEPIQTDRPDQTECPFIVPVGYLQMENGFSFEQASSGTKSLTHPSTLWKYGITKQLELRLVTEFTTEKRNSDITRKFEPLTIGFKVNLFEGRGALPRTSFIGSITSDLLNGRNDSVFYAPAFRFVMLHEISRKLSLAYNVGADWNPDPALPAFLYTLTAGYSLSNKIGAYIETFGFLRKSPSEISLDGGLTYLVTDDLMIDLSGGKGLNRAAPDYYLAFGISYRFRIIGRQ